MAAEAGVVVLVPGDDDERARCRCGGTRAWVDPEPVDDGVVAQAAAPTTSDAVTMTDWARCAARPDHFGADPVPWRESCRFGGAMRARGGRCRAGLLDMAKVRLGFFSFTEITDPSEHRSYNEWHQLDHMPEQYPLPGVVFGQRWVSTPACRRARAYDDIPSWPHPLHDPVSHGRARSTPP